MPEKSILPWFIKIVAIVIGGIISLILSGDIDKEGRIKITQKLILKFTSSIFIGLYVGEFSIDYFDFEHLSYFSQGAVMMLFSIFGMLIVGILYQTIQITLHGKTLSQVVNEIKQTIGALLK